MKESTSHPNSNALPQFLQTDGGKTKSNAIEMPSIALPKGGGAIKGLDEKFSMNAANGTASFSVLLPFSPARGLTPSLSLSYNSGSGNGLFGLGWNLSLGAIKRKTATKLPEYGDAVDSDIFMFSEAEDLVPEFQKETKTGADGNPVLNEDGDAIEVFVQDANGEYLVRERDSDDGLYTIRFYKPRIEGLFARIERWTEKTTGIIKWRITTKDNTTTLFGWTIQSVLSDPEDSSRICEWRPEFMFDDKGNCVRYVYRKEDDVNFNDGLLHNRNRRKNNLIRYTNLYPETILYGNKTPYGAFNDAYPEGADFLFSCRFDYGIESGAPEIVNNDNWTFRTDAFSDYRNGFEIRTARLCRRVLFFHHFQDDEYNGLVRSLTLGYDTATEPDFTFLTSITSVGYIKKEDGTYSRKSLPAVEFAYQKHEWNTEVKTAGREYIVNAPAGIDQPPYQFVDLYREGLSGILSEQANGWYYKHNLGEHINEVTHTKELRFEEAKLVSPKPSFLGLGSALQIADLDADGGKQIVSYKNEPKGYFELDDDNEWRSFSFFRQLPNISFSNSYARFLDLNGDGKADLMISEDNVFVWYESKGREGFEAAKRTAKPFDEEAGAHLVFADEKQTIFLADMSGDGLTDIVRIRNGEVCYWPNLGYGKFGAKVAMDGAPLFDFPDAFDPAYLKLADIDGSGTADIIYLGKNKFSCWRNLSGNRFSAPFEIHNVPRVHNRASITVTDLLGNGVVCIVWSDGLEKEANAPLKYIDLMNGKKPHIMVKYVNNMGKEVELGYTPSTKFYIDDKLDGNPWVTKLHFPVQCLSEIITRDMITGYRFASFYRYHHGYYDHAEREFRGFGMVEQTDSEDFGHWIKSGAANITEQALHQPPATTKTWYHTGAFMRQQKILTQYEHEYWYHYANAAVAETTLPDARIVLSPHLDGLAVNSLTAGEQREAARSCKGMMLRSEVFSLDAPAVNPSPADIQKEQTPYSVAQYNCVIELLQPKGKNKHAVFIVKESEAIKYSYERNNADPRISHNLTIRLDRYGNVLESASVVYPRLLPDVLLPQAAQDAQAATYILYTKNRFTNDVISNEKYRLRASSEVKTFELKNVSKVNPLYSPADFNNILTDAQSDEAGYEEMHKPLVAVKAQRRLIEQARTTYYNDDLQTELPLHRLQSRAFPFQNYQLAFTPSLLNAIYAAKVPAAAFGVLMPEGKYVHSKDENGLPDTNWWIPSGTKQFISGAETAVDAKNRFYVPVSYTDPYGTKTTVTYYSNYYLFIETLQDHLGNRSRADVYNFRTLTPRRVRDINNNISETLADELGIIKATAVMGKDTDADGIGDEADHLTGLSELTDAETTLIQDFFTVPDTPSGVADSVTLIAKARQLLQNASARFVYDLDVYKTSGKPVVVATILREEHSEINPASPLQLSFEYASSGKVIMKKAGAEPGNAKRVRIMPGDSVLVNEADTFPLLRWIGNGRTVINNKGNTVKQYEPYFSVTHRYEDNKELVETGVTPIMYYDAVSRLIKTELPDGTFSKGAFDSWSQTIYDTNDTSLQSDWYKRRTDATRPDFISDAKEHSAALKSAQHADTPTQLHFDTLGRPVLQIENNGKDGGGNDILLNTKVELDIEGNLRSVTDARELPSNGNRGNLVMQYQYDMLGNRVYQDSMDTGKRWLLNNILGNPLCKWDERNHQFQYLYDELHRPTESLVLGGDGAVALNHIFDRIIYGESLLTGVRTEGNRFNEAALQAKNILGQAIQHYDTGGLIESPEYDFKGKPLFTTRKLFSKYKEVANWTAAAMVADLEAGSFTFITQTDALERIKRQTAPDGSIITPAYNEAGLLNSETVRLPGEATAKPYIKNIDYNEKRHRCRIVYGNDVTSAFTFNKQTFRLQMLESKRQTGDPLQDWSYTYDAAGNLTHIEDKKIPVVFFDNQKITGLSEYTYDALYHLTEATGRENDSALLFGNCDNWDDKPFLHDLAGGDAMMTRSYTQQYRYDEAGNITQMKHTATGGNWTRNYIYETGNNRLASTHIGDIALPANYTAYKHHPKHGYLEELPHLETIRWNCKEEVVLTSRQHCTGDNIPVITYYQYDAQGQRIRKITENFSANNNPTRKEERIYLSGYELYKQYTGANAGLERTSLSLLDNGHRFVMIERRNGVDDGTDQQLVRYQFHNHLGSACLELNEAADVVFYEEYHPYGTTAYRAKNKAIRAAAKRYRYTGMERDDETGLEYHSARYYLPWLGRWLSADPVGIADGVNLYAYCRGNPVSKKDDKGTQTDESSTAVGLTFSGSGVTLGAFPVSAPPNPNRADYVLGLGRAGMGPGSYMDRAEANTGLLAINIQDSLTLRRNLSLGRPLTLSSPGGNFPTGPAMERVFATGARTDGGNLHPMFSGIMVQEALEGGQAGTIHADMRGIQLTPPLRLGTLPGFSPDDFHSSSEARQVVAHLASTEPGERQVDIVIQHEEGVSTIPRGANRVSGAPLPASLAERMPNINNEPEPPAAPSSGSSGGSSGSSSGSSGSSSGSSRPSSTTRSSGSTGNSSGGSSGGGSGSGVVAGGLRAVGTAVPGVVETEAALMSAAALAAQHTATASLVGPLMTAAEAVPVVAGVGVVGAGAGHAARAAAQSLGASESTANTVGLGAAVLTGAALGSFIPGVGTAVGAGIGALVAGGLYLWSL